MFVHYYKTTKAMNFCLNKTRTSLRKYEVGCEGGKDASSTTPYKLCTAYRKYNLKLVMAGRKAILAKIIELVL